MSKKTYLEAIEYVLDSEMQARDELIVFRPGARPAFEEDERDIALPRMGAGCVSVALGAALYGMHPVLDLRQEKEAAAILRDAAELTALETPVGMTIVVNADEREALSELSGLRMFAPATPRQAAGFLRAALRSEKAALLLADQTLYGTEDEVPEEEDFILLPLDGEEESVPAEEAACGEQGGAEETDAFEETDDLNEPAVEEALPEETACEEELAVRETEAAACEEAELFEETEEAAVPEEMNSPEQIEPAEEKAEKEELPRAAVRFCAMRSVVYSMDKLREMAEELEAPEEWLVGRCMERASGLYGEFVWQYEADALPGECACFPPEEEKPFIWLGCDMLSVSYDAGAVMHAEAAGVLRAVKRLLEKPALLIYDKENEAI